MSDLLIILVILLIVTFGVLVIDDYSYKFADYLGKKRNKDLGGE